MSNSASDWPTLPARWRRKLVHCCCRNVSGKMCQERLNGLDRGQLVRGCWANWRQWFTQLPTQLPYTVPPHSSPTQSHHTAPPHSPPTQLPPRSPRGTARPTSTGEGAKHISRRRGVKSVNTLCLPTCRGEGCSVPLNAATTLHVVTHLCTSTTATYMCV